MERRSSAKSRPFYRSYVEAWNRRDPGDIAYYYDRPYIGLSGEHAPSLVSTDEEQERWCREAKVGG
jgi:hypothetical protein